MYRGSVRVPDALCNVEASPQGDRANPITHAIINTVMLLPVGHKDLSAAVASYDNVLRRGNSPSSPRTQQCA